MLYGIDTVVRAWYNSLKQPITNMENADAFINAYNKSPEAQKAFVKAILGEIEIVGKSPVDIIPKTRTR